MNREQYAKLSDEEKRAKVAECCGYIIRIRDGLKGKEAVIGVRRGAPKKAWMLPVPDSLNDLNSIQEAVKTLSEEQFKEYNLRLYEVVYNTDLMGLVVSIENIEEAIGECSMLTGATAAQRAEAFVLTMEAT